MIRRYGTVVVATIAVVAAMGGRPRLIAQTPVSTPKPSFEVASIKVNKSGERTMRFSMLPSGRLDAANVPLRMLIQFLYQLQDFQMVGGPDWQTTERFDIVAKSEREPPAADPGTIGPMQLMIQALLADRFKLVAHSETREMPIYALILARPDGRLGPNLTLSKVDCEAANAGRVPPPPRGPDGRPVCGMNAARGHLMVGGFPVSQLLLWFSQNVQRPVVDRTGLVGNYDFDLTFTPNQSATASADQVAPDATSGSIFTAVQEQLGLKLDARRGPVDVLVIDSAERPQEN